MGIAVRTILSWFRRACRPASLPFLGLLFLGSAVFAVIWTALFLQDNNLEHQGIDIIEHTTMIRWIAEPVSPDLQDRLWFYPKGAHTMAAAFLPLFHHNPIQSFRCVVLLALLTMLSAQYTLFCRVLAPAPALMLLVLWQCLCAYTEFADTHFCHQATYFFAQEVGTAAFWLVLVFMTTTAPERRQRWLMTLASLGLASFAYGCHLMPGVMAFGTLGIFYGFMALQNRGREDWLRVLLVLLTGVVTLLSSRQLQLMFQARSIEGGIPFAHLRLLQKWLPTLVVALAWTGWRVTTWKRWRLGISELELALVSGLLVAGLMHTYLWYDWKIAHASAPYSYRKFFFYSFPLSTFLWSYWLAGGWQALGVGSKLAARWGGPRPRLSATLAVMVALVGLGAALFQDPARPAPVPGRDPLTVAALLAEQPSGPGKCYYHDPDYPMGALLASMIGLRTPHQDALYCWKNFYWQDHSLRELVRDGVVGTILFPVDTDPREFFEEPVQVERDGPFWRCDLGFYRQAPSKSKLSSSGPF